jgi:hypothetical protein
VWLALALDFVANRLETGEAGLFDVISVISLGDQAEVLIREQPTSWLLYNRIVHIYENKTVPPRGHGNYIPSLEVAEEILLSNTSASCATALVFISDGKPSDFKALRGVDREEGYRLITESVESLAKQFGRRLTFTSIGIGHSDDFEMLRSMADAASDYGVQGSFQLPSLNSSSLGVVFSSVATSLTSTQTEMTDLTTLKQQRVRSVLRESRRRASQEVFHVTKDEFYLYPSSHVSRRVYREWYDDGAKKHHSYDLSPMQNPGAMFVAVNKAAFGEGAERFAYRFFEVGADGECVLGQALVAKESRLVLEGGQRGREKFVKTFCQTQQLARRIAEEFNTKLDELHRVDRATPRVTFLDCSVYELDDKNIGKQSVLVEEKLDHNKWHKWNANNGYVEGMESAPKFTFEAMRSAMDHLTKLDLGASGAIEEGDEDEDSTESEMNEGGRFKGLRIKFTPSQVAQAFSHFSYWATGRKRLICDLQGVFDEGENILKFSDPVMHYHNHRRLERRNVHGRTDRGKNGMAMFFETHKDECGHLCRLVNGGFKKYHEKRGRRQER